jgi:hypothetical protein
MTNKIVCILPICCNPSNRDSCKGEKRIIQYVDGLKKFFEYSDILKEFNVDIYVFDNTLSKNDKLPQQLLDVIPEYVTIITDEVNNYGCINKGAGLIESWRYLKDIIDKYDFLIHFEPRQILQNFNFIQYFLHNQENLFRLGEGNNHFYTGLFSIKCESLINYINNVNINEMVIKYISVEYDIYNYFINNKITYSIRDKMEVIWFANETLVIFY